MTKTEFCFWAFGLLLAVNHIFALVRSYHGVMVTFSGWVDFLISAVWPLGLAVLFLNLIGSHTNDQEIVINVWSIVSVVILFTSFGWVILGAFFANRGKCLNIVVSLFARITASALAVFLLARLISLLQMSLRRSRSVVSSVAGVLFVGAAFSLLVYPLIGTRSERSFKRVRHY